MLLTASIKRNILCGRSVGRPVVQPVLRVTNRLFQHDVCRGHIRKFASWWKWKYPESGSGHSAFSDIPPKGAGLRSTCLAACRDRRRNLQTFSSASSSHSRAPTLPPLSYPCGDVVLAGDSPFSPIHIPHLSLRSGQQFTCSPFSMQTYLIFLFRNTNFLFGTNSSSINVKRAAFIHLPDRTSSLPNMAHFSETFFEKDDADIPLIFRFHQLINFHRDWNRRCMLRVTSPWSRRHFFSPHPSINSNFAIKRCNFFLTCCFSQNIINSAGHDR